MDRNLYKAVKKYLVATHFGTMNPISICERNKNLKKNPSTFLNYSLNINNKTKNQKLSFLNLFVVNNH